MKTKEELLEEMGLNPSGEEAGAEVAEEVKADNPGGDGLGEGSEAAFGIRLDATEKRLGIVETRMDLGVEFTDEELQKGLEEVVAPLREQIAELQERTKGLGEPAAPAEEEAQVEEGAEEGEGESEAEVPKEDTPALNPRDDPNSPEYIPLGISRKGIRLF